MYQFVGNSVWELVKASDAVTIAVLVVLLIMSIICWAIFFYKIMMIKMHLKNLRKASESLSLATSLETFFALTYQCKDTLPGLLFEKSTTTLRSLMHTPIMVKNELNERDFELYTLVLEKTLDDAIQKEHEYMPVLSATAAVSPLLGLFGTVWGLIHAFLRISEKQSADIVTVAPGVAEALITTLAGLLVAIPALLMFHYLQNKIRIIDMKMVSIADACAWLVRQLLVR